MGTTRRKDLFDYVNPPLLIIVSLIAVLPIVNVIAQSLSSAPAIDAGKVFFWPVEATLENYSTVLQNESIWRAFGVSAFITVFGTLISLALTTSLAYPLSRTDYRGRKMVLIAVLITMIFQAPLIPNYLLIRSLSLLDTLWALMLPSAISAFNLFIMRAFFLTLPEGLIESARIDGAGELRTVWSIILPLSKPVMATMGIIYSVAIWNNYSHAMYFINDRKLYPLQLKLREFVITDTTSLATTASDTFSLSPEGLKMTVIVIATLPIMLVYPFLQRYFIKGMLVGSIKS